MDQQGSFVADALARTVVVQEDDGQWRITSRRVLLDTFNFRSLVIPL